MSRRRSILILLLFAAALCLCGGEEQVRVVLKDPATKDTVPYSFFKPEKPILLPKNYIRKPDEFRGVWIATIANLDFPKYADAASFRTAFRRKAEKLRDAGFSAVIFQVRPACDAFYESKFNPWSRYMTGTDGQSLGESFDPLPFMIRTAHEAGLEFHAWLNPYRVGGNLTVTKKKFLETLSSGNFAVKNPDCVLAYKTPNGRLNLFLNPGEPLVLLHILDTVREILEKYPVDAIHFDDYFYPYDDIGTCDMKSFLRYAKPGESLADWRRRNINTMVESVSRLIRKFRKEGKSHARFGISPFGIWANQPLPEPVSPAAREKWKQVPTHPEGSESKGYQSYYTQYADTRLWVRKKWVDYIAPQIYWGFSHSAAPYAAVTDWWAGAVRGTGVDLYVGIGVHRVGEYGDVMDPEEIWNQLLYNGGRPEIKGHVFYSMRNLETPSNACQKKALRLAVENCWNGTLPN